MKQLLKERIIVNEVAAGRLKEQDAPKALREAKGGLSFSSGEKVYVAHGIHAGNFGKFIKEANGGYCNVDMGAAGKSYNIPAIFLTKSQNT